MIKAFECSDTAVDGKQMTLPLCSSESMYILPYSDRVMVTFALHFDASDAVLAKVFLQEFFDTRQKHTVQNAPTVIFGKEVPSEMAPFVPVNIQSTHNFISFGMHFIYSDLIFTFVVLLPRHYAKEKREQAASMIVNFRTYLHYHLKCTKAYLHNRMRSKVSDFLKVLDNAKIA